MRDAQWTKYAEVTLGDFGTLINVIIQRQLLLGQMNIFFYHTYIYKFCNWCGLNSVGIFSTVINFTVEQTRY